jgi:hypothetical protein
MNQPPPNEPIAVVRSKPAATAVAKLLAAVAVLSAVAVSPAHAQPEGLTGGPDGTWKPVAGKLMTRWAKDVRPDNVHQEYPRPQMKRERWQNLNGLWDYAIKPKAEAAPSAFDGKILVPFPVESALSGVAKQVGPENKLWYRLPFKVQADWRTDGQRVLLHFGAVDWEATVAVNGKPVGSHRGGYDPFSFDVTDALAAGADTVQVLTVEVADPTDAGTQPRGKQIRNPHGIWYVPTTGIWQTVWMEPVPVGAVSRLWVETDIEAGAAKVLAECQLGTGMTARATASLNGETVATAEYTNKFPEVKGRDKDVLVDLGGLIIPPGKRRLWSPAEPTLYGLTFELLRDGKPIDTIKSYFAMRKLSVGKDEKGITRLLLNDKFVFQYGPLDQGFWPDGLYTAPTDAAMKYDLDVTKRLGFNMVRKHVKVEPATWYRHCDEIGLLVWQDMPSGDKHIGPNAPEDFKRSPESMANYEREWTAIIDALRPFPSIVMWVPFNEGWGQSDTARIAEMTKKLDPTRWVNSVSGWADRGVGDMHDLHIYPGPGSPKPEEKRAAVLGEFGGLGLPVKGHTWQDEKNWGYRSFTSAEALTDAYLGLLVKLHPLVGEPGLSAAVYTQTTDVEVEVNGLMTYDREVMKMDERRIAAATKRLYGPPPVVTTLVPTSEEKPVEWRHTTDKPADGWQAAAFDDAAWKAAPGGFGTKLTPGTTVRTEWKTPDVWVRRSFELPADFKATEGVHLNVYHDEDAEIYLNGVLAAKGTGYTTAYGLIPISADARAALKPGKNVIAIHCHQISGGQYIDAGLVEIK